MKELNSHIKEEIKVHAQKQVEKRRKHIGSLITHSGHKIWQLNLKTQEISPAEFSDEYANINGTITRNIIKKDNYWYVSALNKQNAFKQFNKMAKTFLENKDIYDRVNIDG